MYLTDSNVRAAGFFTPSGLERVFHNFGGRDPGALEAIARRHGTVFIGSRIEA